MDQIRGVVRDEMERQRERMALLDELDTLAGRLHALDNPASTALSRRPVAARRPASRRRTRSRASRNPTKVEIRHFIAEEGPVSRREINSSLGGHIKSLDAHLKRLVRTGEIQVEGERPRRRYTCGTSGGTSAAFGPIMSAPVVVRPCEGPDDLLQIIGEHAPVTTERLRELTGLGYQSIADWGRMLARRRDATFSGEGSERVWRLFQRQDLASEVMAAIAAEPGRLNEHRIALALRTSEARIGRVCAELLDCERIALTAKGTYTPIADERAGGAA